MPKKRKTKERTSGYKPVFTDEEYELMQNYGVGDLMDEVGVNRIVLLRTMDKMNQVREQLTFRDHLDALRAVSYSTGRIASLLDTRERLLQPYQEVEKRYQECTGQVHELLDLLGIQIHGQEKWGELQFKALFDAESEKMPESERQKRKEPK